MPIRKRVADILTLSRVIIAAAIVCLGPILGAVALPWIILLAIVAWTTDTLDGPIARSSRVPTSTWIGDHDLLVDSVLATSVLVYMIVAGFVNLYIALAFLLVWALLFRRYGLPFTLGGLFQALVYGCFVILSLIEAPRAGLLLVGWLLVAGVVNWPRFGRQLVPAFLAGFTDLRRR